LGGPLLIRRSEMKNVIRLRSLGFAIVGVLMASTAVYAEEQLIAESQSGKVTIDTDSVQRTGSAVEAGFWAYSGAERIAVVAQVEGCDQGQGRIKYKADPANPGTRIRAGRWASDGEEITDRMAVAACEQADSDVKARK